VGVASPSANGLFVSPSASTDMINVGDAVEDYISDNPD
jgi:hypothetical protein